MKTLTRKQRELQEREARILEVSREVVVREGYHGLSMDRVAEALEYSKGTIYNHFSCKEDIILALAVQTTEKRTELFERAA
ncbi:MAG: helix-turn-helix transcriptional regulator, partial [Planctomycetales bacterium]|nr:helix-turn-helix transcriptional regulator [Planctomycetales bacterium]